jgi:hypothetical protein
MALGLTRLHGMFSKKRFYPFILHLGSGRHTEVFAALIAPFSAH